MQKIENYVEVMEILKNELPNCFIRGKDKLPLAVGIHQSVLKHFETDQRFDSTTLRKAVGLYCKGKQYIRGIVENMPRIDMNGNPISTVQKSEEEYALKILAKRKERRRKNEMRRKDRQCKVNDDADENISESLKLEESEMG